MLEDCQLVTERTSPETRNGCICEMATPCTTENIACTPEEK
jgi:hypothetical protein